MQPSVAERIPWKPLGGLRLVSSSEQPFVVAAPVFSYVPGEMFESAINSNGQTIGIAGEHRDDGFTAAPQKPNSRPPADSNRNHGRAFVISRTRLRLPKYCSDTGVTSDNYGSPTLKSGERLNFFLAYGSFEPCTGPATLQIILKNNAKCSLFELLRDVFSERFHNRDWR
jgi:hypothetical protein